MMRAQKTNTLTHEIDKQLTSSLTLFCLRFAIKQTQKERNRATAASRRAIETKIKN